MPDSAEKDQFTSSDETAGQSTEQRSGSRSADEDHFEADSWEPSLLARMRKAMGGKSSADD